MKYLALFRGVNVGGKNVIKMSALRQLLHDLGLMRVQTYIQSGNAVFETNLEEAPLRELIYNGFVERFGFKSDIVLRRANEMEAIINQLPILAEEIVAAEAVDPQVGHLYVYFLDCSLEQSQLDIICKENREPDILRAGERELYLLCHQSIQKSKLAIRTAKAFQSATVRNWKTVCKLNEMLSAL